MMQKVLFYLILVQVITSPSVAQKLTYSADIKPIIEKHCIDCHHAGGPGPFQLDTYKALASRSSFISQVVRSKYMPPWKADPSFQHFKNERILTEGEISRIVAWCKNPKEGKYSSKKSKAKEQEISIPETELKMPSSYHIANDNKDDFRFFYMPIKNPDDTYITSIHFLPGNQKRVHHSRLLIDTTGRIAGINGISEMDPAVYAFQRYPLADEFLYGWVPGNFKFRFPNGFGKKLHKKSNLILNIHYSPSTVTEVDLSKVLFTLASDKQINREVKTMVLRETNISNQPFVIPKDKVHTFYLSSGAIDKDLSLLTIQPHAHLLGKSFRAFAITLDGDLIPLIKVDDWDFNWQTTYEFDRLIKIPAGSNIIMEGTYDNTAANPKNPNFPLIDVGYGWRTVDEMMNLIFYYVDYQKGDENQVLKY
jgi:hypothetical protein